ncbi:MAG: hypothetical protein NT166_13690 [Candidatus Aminicenantes bacterium]|nr:hypothetical protein [Candidatus Aminicenantes bacterium]
MASKGFRLPPVYKVMAQTGRIDLPVVQQGSIKKWGLTTLTY